MALGDGTTWDEANPVDATTASQIDDYDRDLRKGVRSRMAFEHEWPASQSATSEAGKHKFITLQNQSTKPTVSGTQVSAIYCKTSALYFEDTAGVEIQVTTGTSINFAQTGMGTFFTTDSTGASFASGTVYKAQTDGFVLAHSIRAGGVSQVNGYADTANPPVTLVMRQNAPDSYHTSIHMPVHSGHFWSVTAVDSLTACFWVPLGGANTSCISTS